MIRHSAAMRLEKRENMRGGTGTVSITHLFEQAEFGAKVRLCSRLILPPGTGIGPHSHEKEDELFVVIRGTGIITENNTDTAVKAGDATLTGKGGSHSVRNAGIEDLEMLAIIICYA